ncbi:Uncharacterized protein FWK35_00008520 [Aphis craccivora]|uniref:Uncharacterized protein n=1 Tax=Aphis craccivora TaxID=307492 RepID=A0A6G0ZMY7_APHCR|nr:Uncharacterized protein FWK35_00008520 [Aphis craccivora]
MAQLYYLSYETPKIVVGYAKVPKTPFNLLISIFYKDRFIYFLSLMVAKILLRYFEFHPLRIHCNRRKSQKNKIIPLRKIRPSRFLKVSELRDFLRYYKCIDILYKRMFMRYTYTKLRSGGRFAKNRQGT